MHNNLTFFAEILVLPSRTADHDRDVILANDCPQACVQDKSHTQVSLVDKHA